MPLFLREHTSESLHVPAMLCVLVGAAGLVRQRPWLAGVALALAPMFRVDASLLLLPTAWLLAWTVSGRVRLPRSTAVLGIAGAALGLWFAADRASIDTAQGNLPQLHEYADQFAVHLLRDALPWRPDWFAVGLWLPVLCWLAWGTARDGRHHRWAALLALALLWLPISYLDFNETSLPRLQMPSALLVAIAAAGMAEFWLRQTPHPRVWWAVLALTWLVSLAVSLPACLRQTNAHQEDALLRRAFASLPQQRPYWLVTRTYADDAQDLHLHLPTYRLAPKGRFVSLRDWQHLVVQHQLPPVPVYFLRSVRCHAHRTAEALKSELTACRQLATSTTKPALWQDRLRNLHDTPTFDYYGATPHVDVGLYQLGP
jgi:hypothetical protein